MLYNLCSSWLQRSPFTSQAAQQLAATQPIHIASCAADCCNAASFIIEAAQQLAALQPSYLFVYVPLCLTCAVRLWRIHVFSRSFDLTSVCLYPSIVSLSHVALLLSSQPTLFIKLSHILVLSLLPSSHLSFSLALSLSLSLYLFLSLVFSLSLFRTSLSHFLLSLSLSLSLSFPLAPSFAHLSYLIIYSLSVSVSRCFSLPRPFSFSPPRCLSRIMCLVPTFQSFSFSPPRLPILESLSSRLVCISILHLVCAHATLHGSQLFCI